MMKKYEDEKKLFSDLSFFIQNRNTVLDNDHYIYKDFERFIYSKRDKYNELNIIKSKSNCGFFITYGPFYIGQFLCNPLDLDLNKDVGRDVEFIVSNKKNIINIINEKDREKLIILDSKERLQIINNLKKFIQLDIKEENKDFQDGNSAVYIESNVYKYNRLDFTFKFINLKLYDDILNSKYFNDLLESLIKLTINKLKDKYKSDFEKVMNVFSAIDAMYKER